MHHTPLSFVSLQDQRLWGLLDCGIRNDSTPYTALCLSACLLHDQAPSKPTPSRLSTAVTTGQFQTAARVGLCFASASPAPSRPLFFGTKLISFPSHPRRCHPTRVESSAFEGADPGALLSCAHVFVFGDWALGSLGDQTASRGPLLFCGSQRAGGPAFVFFCFLHSA